tara:strand:- start:351 stop:605 length:255 start_codon:yes stop_codon:yes gene_type:complete
MATGANVLGLLIPQGGWVITGNDYEGIQFLECEPITKAQFTAGFAKYDAWKAEQDVKAEAAVVAATAKLAALGLTADDLKALGL